MGLNLKKASLAWKLQNQLRVAYIKGWVAKQAAHAVAPLGIATFMGELSAIHFKADGSRVDYGVLGRRVVTTVFCEFMVDNLITESAEWGDFKFHEMGTGVTGEANGDSDVEAVHGSPATGTQVEGTSVEYKTVATISFASAVAITEHIVMSQSSTGTLMDRTKFAAINGVSGDSIQFTYSLTCTAGG